MIHFDLPKQKSSIIKVLGVGGGGSNAVNYMFAQDIEGVDFIICNTDAKALEQSRIPNKIQLGPHLTQGLGAGANPEVGKQATEESLEEIRRILEVNTKMAFITAGMGGGTGTGGAPIISKICRDLGILTVGIVTTPFGFEGPRRLRQAEEGIRQMQPYVDTLLVISNDKLRMQYGNLKMTDAFGKADNVLATAAKCITDIINSKGTIIVDFADVCTVMKNGGVAILGSATAEGEDRAQLAIEEALSSPLLNDNDIRGAKWILVNINSGDGQHECTMDEFEVINNYLRTQSGEDADLIIGTGYDNTLGNKIGITIIATGFEYKDPFAKKATVTETKKVQAEPEKIVLQLDIEGIEKKVQPQPLKAVVEEKKEDVYAPQLTEEEPKPVSVILPFATQTNVKEEPAMVESKEPLHFELAVEITEPVAAPKQEEIKPVPVAEVPAMKYTEKIPEEPVGKPVVAAGPFLSRPSNIYADAQTVKETPSQPVMQTPEPKIEIKPQPVMEPEQPKMLFREEPADEETNFRFVVKEEPVNTAAQPRFISEAELNNEPLNEEEEQKKRAAERINKLRNLSFNMNSAEANGEYDNVPAYVRRNMELFGNTLTSVEQFYSKYTVKKDENEETQISTINTFLDGKKPD
ncbi:cell division protein FtsZ [Panacibacter ginsenosidivorans]|uniref:Cell division protein FtsZ n=1 Tax=Panacibacter ginsenosidivorans TaxID=1813871 RepID=A0A5B8VCS0_9BACT|nr:cell division protein FtsZ [Panacibacter ginsenosidivorans]QEC68835.1 cell division protein FtsZ [Panacibacter ginsenosidivorans]